MISDQFMIITGRRSRLSGLSEPLRLLNQSSCFRWIQSKDFFYGDVFGKIGAFNVDLVGSRREYNPWYRKDALLWDVMRLSIMKDLLDQLYQ